MLFETFTHLGIVDDAPGVYVLAGRAHLGLYTILANASLSNNHCCGSKYSTRYCNVAHHSQHFFPTSSFGTHRHHQTRNDDNGLPNEPRPHFSPQTRPRSSSAQGESGYSGPAPLLPPLAICISLSPLMRLDTVHRFEGAKDSPIYVLFRRISVRCVPLLLIQVSFHSPSRN